eukprot:TRINITY_DN3516_c0_g1_i1.p1 TRINITY_DN3516_c0_g1~~TRINITY_DN3516_c0_g1_i1.p1  ORF type:complete len:328 (-),score=68.51 TRINITY_DN3516_c0_g1_i1:72-965(-)
MFEVFKKDLENVNLKGKSFLVTGGNAGLGYCACTFFANHGGTVHVVCRSEQKGKEAVQNLIQSSNNPNIHLHICDISEMSQIRHLASQFLAQDLPLDVLIHNAGVMLPTRESTSEGLDKVFATNVLSNFLLTNLLIPVLTKSQDPRVILVSSGGALTEDLNFRDVQSQEASHWDGTRAYAVSKRQQIALTEKLSSQYKSTPISFFCMHPGWADTPGLQSSMPDFWKFYKNSLRSPEEGADTIEWLAVSASVDKSMSGEFFRDREVEYKHLPLAGTSYSLNELNSFWQECCKLANWET